MTPQLNENPRLSEQSHEQLYLQHIDNTNQYSDAPRNQPRSQRQPCKSGNNKNYAQPVSSSTDVLFRSNRRTKGFSLEPFKNLPTISEFPTSLAIARQQKQTLQRDRFNTTALLMNANKQPHLAQLSKII
jgi:hypothetical protein